jgi:acyl-CoA synthetase (AMP-forming)/AMP-acid ligase II
MKRIALALAAAALSTGCVVHNNPPACNDPGNIIFYWKFTSATGATLNCAQAGVDTVRIDIDGQTTWVGCVGPNGVEGITLNTFKAKDYPFSIYGMAGGGGTHDGTTLFMEQATATVKACTNTTVNAALAATGADLVIYFKFAGQTGCPTGVEKVHYNLVAANDPNTSLSSGDVTCAGSNNGFTVPGLPFANYSMRWIQGLAYNAGTSQYEAVYQKCAAPVAHFAADQVTIDLPATTPSTPACQ